MYFAKYLWEDRHGKGTDGMLIDMPDSCTARQLEDEIYHKAQGLYGENIVVYFLDIKRL